MADVEAAREEGREEGDYVVPLASGAQLPVSRLRSRVGREQLLRL